MDDMRPAPLVVSQAQAKLKQIFFCVTIEFDQYSYGSTKKTYNSLSLTPAHKLGFLFQDSER
jgi:hypothetical protein